MRNFTTIFALMVILVAAVTTGCVSKEVQEAKITGDIGYSAGYISENQTNIQKISWTAVAAAGILFTGIHAVHYFKNMLEYSKETLVKISRQNE